MEHPEFKTSSGIRQHLVVKSNRTYAELSDDTSVAAGISLLDDITTQFNDFLEEYKINNNDISFVVLPYCFYRSPLITRDDELKSTLDYAYSGFREYMDNNKLFIRLDQFYTIDDYGGYLIFSYDHNRVQNIITDIKSKVVDGLNDDTLIDMTIIIMQKLKEKKLTLFEAQHINSVLAKWIDESDDYEILITYKYHTTE